MQKVGRQSGLFNKEREDGREICVGFPMFV